jgi:hypothetical protein
MNDNATSEAILKEIETKYQAINQKTKQRWKGYYGQNQLPIGITFKPMLY